ncbi:MAG: hypothetical protein FMNOHCHN_03909 [Ignavibacteriaceae bacterium]|nr:hypothetical protein [Ignavibacteriaceae bacterium]
MKHFMYFQDCEGGMQAFDVFHETDLESLNGWMSDAFCKADDFLLLEWMKTAEIGEIYGHRLGIIVRLKDKKP